MQLGRVLDLAWGTLVNMNVVNKGAAVQVKEVLAQVYVAGYDHRGMEEKRAKPVLQVDDGRIVKRYPSIEAAARAMGVAAPSIHKAIYGKISSCKGYKWMFAQL